MNDEIRELLARALSGDLSPEESERLLAACRADEAVRVELGPKDVAKQAAVLARRDRPGREGKISVALADVATTAEKLLIEIHQSMHDKALAFRRANTHSVTNYEEFKVAVET